MHTILGTGLPISLHRSDGVVSISSAQHPKAVSEVQVPSTHNGVLRRPETFHEIKRILQLHLLGPESSYGPESTYDSGADASYGATEGDVGSKSLSIGIDEAFPIEGSQPVQIGPANGTP
jgi:hypothetical protein